MDEILRSIIHSFDEFRHKLKGKDVYSSSGLSIASDSMMEPKSGMMVGKTSFLEWKCKE
jgi:hypothetical protein